MRVHYFFFFLPSRVYIESLKSNQTLRGVGPAPFIRFKTSLFIESEPCESQPPPACLGRLAGV